MGYILSHFGQIVELTAEHVRVTLIAVVGAVALGVPLGMLVTRWRWLYSPVLAVTGMLYTIPSLALFAFLLPFLGLGVRPTVVALILYSQLAIVRNTAVGINGVDRAVIEAATGMGMTSHQILRMVELPLAVPIIMAGVRTVVVMDIGVATIAAYIGAGGLGVLIYQGITSVYPDKIVAGALPVALLALAADYGLSRLERRLTPRGVGRQVGAMDILEYILRERAFVLQLISQHLVLTLYAVGIAVAIALPLGILSTRLAWLKTIVINLANLGQTIPSLAILGLLIPLLGIGFRPALVALVLRAVLPIATNTCVGIAGTDRSVIEAGRGMGMRDWQILTMVELPLALPVIMVGIRTATVMSISIATLAALIGAGGLGDLILRGMAMVDRAMLLASAITTALLAIMADLLLGRVEHLLRPKGIRL